MKDENKTNGLSPTALANKRAYIHKYNREKYHTYTFKLRVDSDSKLIEAIKNSGESVCYLTRKALEEHFGISRQARLLIRIIQMGCRLDFYLRQKKITNASVTF